MGATFTPRQRAVLLFLCTVSGLGILCLIGDLVYSHHFFGLISVPLFIGGLSSALGMTHVFLQAFCQQKGSQVILVRRVEAPIRYWLYTSFWLVSGVYCFADVLGALVSFF